MTESEIDALSATAHNKQMPELPVQAARILQDFGAGPLFLWPLLNIGRDPNESFFEGPSHRPVFLCAAALFGLGWLIRKLTSR
jgi:hypothetical protein